MKWILLCALWLASPAWAAPFATAWIPVDPLITACDYEDTTTGETARVSVVVDTARGQAADNYRVCKFDIAHWVPGSVHAARMRSVHTSTGEVSTWTAATLDRPAASQVVLSLVGAAAPPVDPPPPPMAAALVNSSGTTNSSSSTSIATTTSLSVTTGNALVVVVKWEAGTGTTVTSVTDTAGNTYTVDQQRVYGGGGGEPCVAMAYCVNCTGHASNLITVNFSASVPWRSVLAMQWSGVATSSPTDGTHVQAEGSSGNYATAAITTTQSGLVIAGVGGYTPYVFQATGAGSPTGSIVAQGSGSPTVQDMVVWYYISSSGQSVTPQANWVTGDDRWVMVAMALKDTGGAVTTSRVPISPSARLASILIPNF